MGASKSMDKVKSMDFSNSRLTINSKDASNSKEENNGDVECITLTFLIFFFHLMVVGSHLSSAQNFFFYTWFFSYVENSTEPTTWRKHFSRVREFGPRTPRSG
jgi:hypothetical protein